MIRISDLVIKDGGIHMTPGDAIHTSSSKVECSGLGSECPPVHGRRSSKSASSVTIDNSDIKLCPGEFIQVPDAHITCNPQRVNTADLNTWKMILDSNMPRAAPAPDPDRGNVSEASLSVLQNALSHATTHDPPDGRVHVSKKSLKVQQCTFLGVIPVFKGFPFADCEH